MRRHQVCFASAALSCVRRSRQSCSGLRMPMVRLEVAPVILAARFSLPRANSQVLSPLLREGDRAIAEHLRRRCRLLLNDFGMRASCKDRIRGGTWTHVSEARRMTEELLAGDHYCTELRIILQV